jgi:hypothetical protein
MQSDVSGQSKLMSALVRRTTSGIWRRIDFTDIAQWECREYGDPNISEPLGAGAAMGACLLDARKPGTTGLVTPDPRPRW